MLSVTNSVESVRFCICIHCNHEHIHGGGGGGGVKEDESIILKI